MHGPPLELLRAARRHLCRLCRHELCIVRGAGRKGLNSAENPGSAFSRRLAQAHDRDDENAARAASVNTRNSKADEPQKRSASERVMRCDLSSFGTKVYCKTSGRAKLFVQFANELYVQSTGHEGRGYRSAEGWINRAKAGPGSVSIQAPSNVTV